VADVDDDEKGQTAEGEIVEYECENGHRFGGPPRPQHPHGGLAGGTEPEPIECPECGSTNVSRVA
jgi:hypothetical protein